MDGSSLPDRLKQLRKEAGKTQIEVADAVGIDRSTLAGLETSHDNPGRETLIALANYYDVSIDWLASGEGEKRPGRPRSRDEQLVLEAYRKLPPDEAILHRDLLLARTNGAAPAEPEPELAAEKRGRR